MTFLIFAVVAGLASEPAPTEGRAVDTTAAAIVADCSARKFETRVELEQNGQKRQTKLKLCAAKDGDDAAWAKTLEDAKAKIAGHPEISADSKVKIAAEIDAEIARTNAGGSAPIAPAIAEPLPPPAVTLPPASPAVAASVGTVQKQIPAKPRLTVRCLEQGERGDGGPCSTGLERNTRLAIRADGDLADDISLRFVRRGDVRGEVALARMRQGQSVRLSLPPKLCAGVASSKIEIQIVGANRVVETLGPYWLRCM